MRVLIYEAGNHMELLPSMVHAVKSAQPDTEIVVYTSSDSYSINTFLELLHLECGIAWRPPLGEAFDLTIIDPLLPANRFRDVALARERLTIAMDGIQSRNILFGIHVLSERYLLSGDELTAANRGVLLFGDYLQPPENMDNFIIYPAYFGNPTRQRSMRTICSVAGFRKACRDYPGTVNELCKITASQGITVHLVGKRSPNDLYPSVMRTVAAAGENDLRLHPDLCWPDLHDLLSTTGFLLSLPTNTAMYKSRLSITGITNLAIGYRIPLIIEREIADVALKKWLSRSYQEHFHYQDQADMLHKIVSSKTLPPERYDRFTSELQAVYDEWAGHNELAARDILNWLR